MNQMTKQIWLSLWKRYHRQWILANIILVIFIPFLALTLPHQELSFTITLAYVSTTLFVMIMSLVFYGYLYHARQANFQFSLPYPKMSLFWSTLTFILILALVPTWIYLSLTLLLCSASYQEWTSLVTLTIHLFYVSCAGALTASLAKRILDAIPLYLFYVLIPIALFLFSIGLLDSVPVLGWGNYYDSIAIGLLKIVLPIEGLQPGYIICYLSLGSLYLWLAQHFMKKLSVETIGSKTTHWLTYPLLISLVVTMMSSLGIYAHSGIALLMAAIVFIIYLSLVFYAKQEIYCDFKLIIHFVSIQIFAACLSSVVMFTHGFGTIYEVPQTHIKKVSIELFLNEKYYHFVSEQPMVISQVRQLHQNIEQEVDTSHFSTIQFDYRLKDDRKLIRNYVIKNPKKLIQELRKIDPNAMKVELVNDVE